MEPGNTIAGRFRFQTWIGRGGTADVFGGIDELDGSKVAVKLLEATTLQERERFLREANLLSKLSHPYIVQYRAHGLAGDGRFFLAMEWLEGEDLRGRLARCALDVESTVQLGRRIADALATVHESGIVHRDLKPSNIFLVSDHTLEVKLGDFGIAHLTANPRVGASPITHTGTILGTPGYLAPEQIRGRSIDERADLFALGCILFECLTGAPAFSGQELMAVLGRILFEPAPHVLDVRDDVPESLARLVASLLEKDPDARPKNAKEVLRCLESVGDVSGPAPVQHARPMLTGLEQRVATIVAAASLCSLDDDSDDERFKLLQDVARDYGARLEVLPDDSIVALVDSTSTPLEQAMRAARLAIAFRERLGDEPLAIVTGRTVVSDALPVGDAIERAAHELRRAPRGAIVMDEHSVGLLGTRFEIAQRDEVHHLVSELDAGKETRTVLGKHTPCVGRDKELRLLLSTIAESDEETAAHAVVITGEAGIGKSRLCQEVLRRVQSELKETAILFAHGDPVGAGAAYRMVSVCLRRAFGVEESDSASVRQKKIVRATAKISNEEKRELTAVFLGELLGVPFAAEARRELRAARLDPALMHEHVSRAFVDWLESQCRVAPQLVVLEDLHWGDLSTVRLMDRALRTLGDARLTVMAFGRPELRELFPRLWEERNVIELKLGRLSKKASHDVIRSALGAGVENAIAEELVARSEGNALFLEELIRANASGNFDRLPDTLLGMMETRIGRLDPRARQVLRVASVFGEAFLEEGVEHLLGSEVLGVRQWLAVLKAEEIVAFRSADPFARSGEYVFRHTLLRDACYAMLPAADRITGHRLAAEWLEGRGKEDAVTLAEHYQEGGERKRAAVWYLRAARDALHASDLNGAVQYADRGVSMVPHTGTLLGELRLVAGEALTWMGQSVQALTFSTEAAGLLPRGSPAWYVAIADLSDAAAVLGKWDDVREWVRALFEFSEVQAGALESRIAALSRVSFASFLSGHSMEASHALQLASEALSEEALRNPLVAAHYAHAQAAQCMVANDRERAVQHYNHAALCFETAGADRHASGARTSAGAMLIELGMYEAATNTLEDALVRARGSRSAYALSLAKLNLGISLALQGELRRGAELEAEAACEFEEQRDVRLEASARCALAETWISLEQFHDAEREARRAMEVAADLAPAQAAACAVLARVLLLRGQHLEALRVVSQGRSFASTTTMEEREMLLYFTLAEAMRVAGQRDQAIEEVQRQKQRLLAQAENIRDPAIRERFLYRVPDNRRVLELAESFGI